MESTREKSNRRRSWYDERLVQQQPVKTSEI
jgi:hypothetical protein